jgi:hypothetical protein
MFIGGNKQKLKSDQVQNFVEDIKVNFEVRAIVYVPGGIVAGICFPNIEIENKFPHLTLMVSIILFNLYR